jgi:hypothetical protein
VTKTEKTLRALVRPDETEGEFYSLASNELRAIRRYLRDNSHKHRECKAWLQYYSDFIPHDKPRKGILGTKRFTADDRPDFDRFAAFCRQLLAMNGIVVA